MDGQPIEEMAGRLDRLERENLRLDSELHRLARGRARLQCAGASALLVLVVLAVGGARRADEPGVVEARQVIIRDADGKVRIQLCTNPDGSAALNFLDGDNVLRFGMALQRHGGGGLIFLDREQKTRLAMLADGDDSPMVYLADKEGTPRLRQNLVGGVARQEILSEGGQGGISMEVAEDGSGGLSFIEKGGRERFALSVSPDGRAGLSLSVKEKRGSLVASVSASRRTAWVLLTSRTRMARSGSIWACCRAGL